ncbi:hypothetical protein IM40_01430 [Candidatus Paracaedimonas acanthamoebae]|nr:hypothetical protein IM40_01430 [Candidatus Paracaedimonas acanthamoebae]
MKFKFSSLVLSALLSTSIATASNIKLSDAYHGLIPEEVKEDKGKLKTYQETVISQFEQKLHHLMSMQDQLDRFYAPYARKGGEYERIMANAVCDFIEAKVKKLSFLKILYEAHLGETAEYMETAVQMKGCPPKVGQHAALLREIKEISLEIEKAQEFIKSQPDQKTAWEKEIGEKKKTIQTLGAELGVLQKQISDSEEALKEKQNLLKDNQEEIHKAKRLLGECSDEIKELQTKYEETKASVIPLLQPVIEKNEVNESSDPQDSQEKSVEDSDIERIDPAVQQLKALDAEYVAKEKELLDKKGLSLAHITELQEQHVALQTQIENLAKEKETFEKELQHKKEQVSTEECEIDSIKRKIEAQAEEKTKLEAKLKQWLLEKQDKQDEADTYASIKYLTLLNIYSALPNDDFDYYGYENFLTTLSSNALPTILMLVNKRAAQVGSNNVKWTLDRELPKFQSSVTKHVETQIETLRSGFFAEAQAKNLGYNDVERKSLAALAVDKFQKLVTGENIITSYEELSKDRYNYYPSTMKGEEFLISYSSVLDSLRADHQIKASMTKWRSKISTTEDSLIQRLGLDSALFNPDFSIASYPQFLSFPELHMSLKGTSLVPYPVRLKEKAVWSLGKMQLGANFFEAMIGKDEKVWRRISPVVRFVESKQSEEKKQNGFKHFLHSDKNKAVEYAYLKYISYMNMLYALRHDEKGETMPELKIVDSALENLLVQPLSSELRLDNIMAAKAHKWGSWVMEHGKTFITENGLEAHTFTPLFADKDK